MSFLVAVMLRHLDKERAFWLLVHLVDHLPDDYYTKTAITECAVFQVRPPSLQPAPAHATLPHAAASPRQSLVRERVPTLAEHLGDLFPLGINFLAVRWFVTLFVHELPLETTLTVWDHVFMDGLVALYRCARVGKG